MAKLADIRQTKKSVAELINDLDLYDQKKKITIKLEIIESSN